MERRPTGGRWSFDAAPMFFFAAMHDQNTSFTADPQVPALIAINDLVNTGRKVKRTSRLWGHLMEALDAGQPVFMDSGVFNLTNEHMRAHGITMDEALALAPEDIDNFDWLFDTYLEIVTDLRDVLWGYVEIDQGGMENKKITRARLHKEGLDPIPVYHPLNDGWDYFDELVTGYERICVGNLVQAGPDVRERIIATVTERLYDHPDTWVHYLGLTPNPLQYAYPMISCDSSSWTYVWRSSHHAKVGAMGVKSWKLPPTLQSELRSVSTLGQDEWLQTMRRDGEIQIVDQHLAMANYRDHYETLRDLGVHGF